MKRSLLLLLFLPFVMKAQNRQGLYAGVSAGIEHFNTYWYYYRYSGGTHDNYPSHSTNRPLLGINLEKKSLLQKNAVRFDLEGSLLLGIGGKTKAEWLAGEPVASNGGWTVGLQGAFKIALPLTVSKQTGITPVLGLGPQLMALHSSGTTGAAASRGYGEGWTEFVLVLQATAGVDFQLNSFTFTPQLHVGLIGYSSSTWEPNENGVDLQSSPTMIGCSIKIAKRL